jgi:tetratricopeptide (TPR) repeat protein
VSRFFRNTAWLILVFTGWTFGQVEVQKLVTLWQNEQLNLLQSLLPAAVKKYPQNPTSQFFVALFDKNGEPAYTRYKSEMNRFPIELADDGLMKMAQYHQIKGEYGQAADYYKTLIRRYPNSPLTDDARYQRCQCYMAEGNTDSARISLQQFIQSDKRSAFLDWAILDLESLAGEKVLTKPIPAVTPDLDEFFIQVGAYRMMDNAKQYLKKLREAGFDAQVAEKKVGDKKLFALWIGRFNSREDATDFAKKNVVVFAPDYTIVSKK